MNLRKAFLSKPKLRAGVLFLVAFAALLAAGTLFGIIPSADTAAAADSVKNPFDGDPAAIKAGAALFDERCAECHGDGTGLSGPDLTDNDWTYGGSDADVEASVKKGRPGGMPSWSGEIPDDDIWKIIAFIRSIKK